MPCHPRGTTAGCHTASDWRRQARSTSLGLGHHRAAQVQEEAREGGLLGVQQALHVKPGAVQTKNNPLIMLGLSGINIPLDYRCRDKLALKTSMAPKGVVLLSIIMV